MKALVSIPVITVLVIASVSALGGERGNKVMADRELHELIQGLQKAVSARDMVYVHSKISKQFMLYRDFGGMYSNKMSHVQNFHGAFELDNTRLFPEYKDHGWKKLEASLVIKQFEISRFAKGELCGPAGALDKKPYPLSQLCFKKQPKGDWLISSYIFGGD